MSDLLERLREGVPSYIDRGPGGDLEITRWDTAQAGSLMVEAADTIEQLTKERDEAMDALLWLDHYEPELVAAAAAKVGLKLAALPPTPEPQP